jgi:hypothetical protein
MLRVVQSGEERGHDVGPPGRPPPVRARLPAVNGGALQGEVEAVPLGAGGDATERSVHVIDESVELFAGE